MTDAVFAAEPARLLIAAAAGIILLLLLIGLGSLFGGILEVSGGAQSVARTLIDKFGEKKAGAALGITGLAVGTTVFFEAGVVILIPLAFGLAKKTKKSTLYYVIPLLAGLAAMVCAINGGATAFSHVNDSGFWLVSSLLEIDEKTTLKTWTMMETIIGLTGLVCAIAISLFA